MEKQISSVWKKAFKVSVIAELTQPCAPGYFFRVIRRDYQANPLGVGLFVRGLPSVSPVRIAVTGRQKL